MKKLLLAAATFLIGIAPARALNDTIGVTVGAGKTANLIKFGSNNVISETGVCDATTENQCASVSAAGAVKVDGSAVTQPISAASLPLPAGAATAAGLTTINTTLGSPFQAGGNIGTVTTVSTVSASRTVGNAGATMDAPIGLGTAPTNALITGLQCNNSTLTPTAGQTASLQGDANCYLEVNVKTATGLAQGSTTSGQTGSMIMGAVTNAAPSYTTAQTAYASLTTAGAMRADLNSIASTAILTGTGAVGAGSQRVAVGTDTATIAGSSPTAALAAVGAVATAAAPPANAIYLGANASGATGGHVAGLISCDNHVFKHITTATDTLAVQGVASQTIYVCGWRSRAAGTATWFLENTASTNANCSSANTQITGVATEAANTGETWGGNFWSGLKNTSANGLCINSTGTGGIDVDLWYTQF
jgi:hypothetical protein